MTKTLRTRTDTKNYTTQDIYNEIMEDVQLIKDLGYKVPTTYMARISTRMIKKLGMCEELVNEKLYRISISDFLLKHGSSEEVHNTIMHEVIHSLPNCMSHGNKWKATANRVCKKYPEFGTIERCCENQEYRKQLLQANKYIAECTKCGCKNGWIRRSRVFNEAARGNARCTVCGSRNFKCYKLN